jgi:hypothetical protein
MQERYPTYRGSPFAHFSYPVVALSEVWLWARLTILVCVVLIPKEGGGFSSYVILSSLLAGLG